MNWRDPENPMEDLLKPRRISNMIDEDYEEEVQVRLRLAHQEAKNRLAKSSEVMKRAHDKGTTYPTFRMGDMVYLKVGQQKPGVGKKLAAKWAGQLAVGKLVQ